jgi:hypothetical protein
MKRLLISAGLLSVLALSALAASYTGYIIDDSCAGKKAMWGNVQCAQSCIKRGAKAVLVTDDGTVYQIAEQDKVVPEAGKKVMINGTLTGKTIKVDSVTEQ